MTELPSQRDDSKSSDPLASVERLLMPNGRLAVSSLPGGKQEEAVRLLLASARQNLCPGESDDWFRAKNDLLAFARSLDGEPS